MSTKQITLTPFTLPAAKQDLSFKMTKAGAGGDVSAEALLADVSLSWSKRDVAMGGTEKELERVFCCQYEGLYFGVDVAEDAPLKPATPYLVAVANGASKVQWSVVFEPLAAGSSIVDTTVITDGPVLLISAQCPDGVNISDVLGGTYRIKAVAQVGKATKDLGQITAVVTPGSAYTCSRCTVDFSGFFINAYYGSEADNTWSPLTATFTVPGDAATPVTGSNYSRILSDTTTGTMLKLFATNQDAPDLVEILLKMQPLSDAGIMTWNGDAPTPDIGSYNTNYDLRIDIIFMSNGCLAPLPLTTPIDEQYGGGEVVTFALAPFTFAPGIYGIRATVPQGLGLYMDRDYVIGHLEIAPIPVLRSWAEVTGDTYSTRKASAKDTMYSFQVKFSTTYA